MLKPKPKVAIENMRFIPSWKKVDCPTCRQPKGKNCFFEVMKVSGFNTFVHRERLLLGDELNRNKR